MNRPNVLCLAIDGLRASALGTYGGAWGETPAFDALAAESIIFDNAWADASDLDQVYRAWWHGRAALAPIPGDECRTLPDILAGYGLATVLVTDDLTIAQHPLASDFDERVFVDAPNADRPADNVAETGFAQFCVEAIDTLQLLADAGEPFFAWLHASGLNAPWDAPLEFREALAEEDDPRPPADVDVPCRMLDEDYDPDDLLGITQSYSGQVVALDHCLAALLDQLERLRLNDNTLVALTAPRAFPLGEHLRVGMVDDALYGERLHVPLLLRMPAGQGKLTRRPDLVRPADLAATILAWVATAGDDIPGDALAGGGRSLLPASHSTAQLPPRDHIVCVAPDGERAVLTPAWYLRVPVAAAAELFVKPDDRWEANEVADRVPDVVKELQAALDRYAAAAQAGRWDAIGPLADKLV